MALAWFRASASAFERGRPPSRFHRPGAFIAVRRSPGSPRGSIAVLRESPRSPSRIAAARRSSTPRGSPFTSSRTTEPMKSGVMQTTSSPMNVWWIER